MANPNTNTLTDIFLPDGFGAFGFGDGGYGGSPSLLNPQWNTNSGNFGIDPITGLSYVEATSTPSYVGAALYNIEYSYFFAKIVPATIGAGSVQTALVIKHDAHNYVEMSIGPDNQFKAYVSNDLNITLASPALPTYDPVAHAYWRIRNDDRLVFHFDTSPNGYTWTELGNASYLWDATSVVVTIFSGFTGLDSPGNIALISSINLPGNTLALASTGRATASANGLATVSNLNALSANANAVAGSRAQFNIISSLPEGGLTDFAWTSVAKTVDPIIFNYWNQLAVTVFNGSSPLTQAAWQNTPFPIATPTTYRDGSYFQPAAYAVIDNNVQDVVDNAANLLTSVQVEQTDGLNNRLSTNAFIYSDSCCYTPGVGTTSVTRSTDKALTGQYSGKIVNNNTPLTTAAGDLVYFAFPSPAALVSVRQNASLRVENLFGSVSLSTTRANTSWYAGFVFYDANFNILSESTYQHATITNKNTHPGGGVWQAGVVYDKIIPSTAAWAAVVPVVIVPSSATLETVYMSNHSITGASLFITETGTNYAHPKTSNINIKADRVNYAVNSGFNVNTFQWVEINVGTSGTPNAGSIAWDGTTGYNSLGSMRVDIAVPSGSFTGPGTAKLGASTRPNLSSTGSGRYPIVQGLKIGHTYTISMWIKRSANCPNIYMNVTDANGLGPPDTDVASTNVLYPENTEGNWTRVQTTYTVPPAGLQDYNFYVYTLFSDISHAPFSYWVDSLLVEETDTYNGYFDGGFASADYKWEANGTANACRSYYYKNYTDKFLNLNNMLASVLPVGEYYNLKFAQPIT